MKSVIYQKEVNLDKITVGKERLTRSTVKIYFAEKDGFISHVSSEIEYFTFEEKNRKIVRLAEKYANTDVKFSNSVLPSPF